MAGEDRFVLRLLGELPPSRAGVLVGPGDDAAVVETSAGLRAITTDMLVEGVDFLPGEPPEAVGRRAMAVNLSDLAAMGARPEHFLLSIAFPPLRGEDYPLAVARGALSRATPLSAALIGGDVSAAPITVVSVALWGRPERDPILRSGARPGDLLFLSGHPGRAAAGLRLARARAEGRSCAPGLPEDAARELLAAYRDPEPRVTLGLAIAGIATAAIDVSDGLGIDAGRLAEASGARVVIERERLPISPALEDFAGRESLDPVDLLLSGGDDYELLFCVPPPRVVEIPREGRGWVTVRQIGRVETGRGAILRGILGERDVGDLGHDHLRAAESR